MPLIIAAATCALLAGHRAQQRTTGSPRTMPDRCTREYDRWYYCRAGAYQYVRADGAHMSTPVLSPAVSGSGIHSLAELAVESSDHRQIIEIGWRIYRRQDQQPRLFIFHWVDGKPACYNTGCGFVQDDSATVTPNMVLTPGTPVQFAIRYLHGDWWYGYDGTWFGYLPGSLWHGRFTATGLVQFFGEVASTTASPCTDMGNGSIGSSAWAATMTDVGFYNGSAAVSLRRVIADDPAHYDSQLTSPNSFRYGGPGAC